MIIILSCTQNSSRETSSIPVREHSVQSVLWIQMSSEYKAQCYQAFNLARLSLDNFLDKYGQSEKPLAIITDVDETILDNSPFNAKMIELDVEYSKDLWFDWGKKEEADPIPGALEFFNYAKSQNVEIFYISNRDVKQKNETIANLEKLGFPNLNDSHLLLKDTTSKKQPRRDIVLSSHNVLLYIGDNLSDFSSLFDGLDRSTFVDSVKSKFGFEFIVLPNPMYGDWETKELYEGKYTWSSQQKDSIRKVNLKSY